MSRVALGFRGVRLSSLMTSFMLLGLSGCGEDERQGSPAPDVQAATCEIVQAVDNDCDGVRDASDRHPGLNDWQFDSDGDRVPDLLDKFNGDDLGDADGDGWANWADASPNGNRVGVTGTLGDLIAQSQTAQGAAEAVRQQRLHDLNNSLVQTDVGQRIVAEAWDNLPSSRDSDGDQVSDLYDTQTWMRYGDDHDGDGIVNGRDDSP
jgi:hypothetical protein